MRDTTEARAPERKDATLAHDEVTLGDKVVSAALWALGVSWLVPSMGAMMALQTVLRPDQIEWLNRLYTYGQVRLTGSRWRAEVHPAIDPSGVYMFCSNHVNHFDHCTMYCATPHFKQGLEAADHFEYPVYGWFMKQRGTIPVHKGGKQLDELRAHMQSEMDKGHSILTFPEGHRTRDGRVRPFKRGIFFIARDLGIPIVPVAVTGMQHVMSASSWVIRPGHTVTVHCEEPVETAGLTDEEIPALVERVRAPIVARVDAYFAEHDARRRRRA
jgi:1-acyl-sn-glycerol-3-phosphate acyltransferase